MRSANCHLVERVGDFRQPFFQPIDHQASKFGSFKKELNVEEELRIWRQLTSNSRTTKNTFSHKKTQYFVTNNDHPQKIFLNGQGGEMHLFNIF